MSNIIVDFETLGNSKEHIILGVAYYIFDFQDIIDNKLIIDNIKTQTFKFDIKEQFKRGKTVCDKTIAWWKKQNKESQKILLPSDEDITTLEFCDDILNIPNIQDFKFWSRGIDFDGVLFNGLFEDLNLTNPIPFWSSVDVRSFIDGLSCFSIDNKYIPDVCKSLPKHTASNDIIIDLIRIQDQYHKRKIT